MIRKVLKYVLVACLVFVLPFTMSGQNLKSVIKTQAMDMAGALLKKDFQTFARYMHPKIIELAGGREQLLSKMDTASKMADQYGAKISRVLIGHPNDIITYKKELQTTLSQTTDIKTMLGMISLETTLIAISEDDGAHWYFIDTSAYNLDEIKKSMPDISPDIKIPPFKQPKFTPIDPEQ